MIPKELEQEEQIKPKISRRKKITMKWRPNTKDHSNYELVIFLVCFYFEVKAPYYVQGSLATLVNLAYCFLPLSIDFIQHVCVTL